MESIKKLCEGTIENKFSVKLWKYLEVIFIHCNITSHTIVKITVSLVFQIFQNVCCINLRINVFIFILKYENNFVVML